MPGTTTSGDAPLTVDITTDAFRDHIARALLARRHAEIAEQIAEDFGPDDDCHGYMAERCGGCGMCVLMQQTHRDFDEEGFASFRAEADELLANVRGNVAFEQREGSDTR